jgi:hypothetical protein
LGLGVAISSLRQSTTEGLEQHVEVAIIPLYRKFLLTFNILQKSSVVINKNAVMHNPIQVTCFDPASSLLSIFPAPSLNSIHDSGV